jgi:nuclear pore complex protein Nup93
MAQVLAGTSGNSSDVFGSEQTKRSSTLNDLVQSSKNLPRRLDDIDTLHLSLNEIQKRAYQLRKYNKEDTKPNLYTKAHYLLIGKGLTIEEIENDLNSLMKLSKSNDYNKEIYKTSKFYKSSASESIKPSNLDSYLYKQKDEDVLLTIENSLSTAARDFDSFVNKNINLDWKQKKKELCDKLSNVIKREPSVTLTSPEKKVKKLTQKELIEKQLTWGTNKPKSIISSNFTFNDVQSAKNLDSIVNPNISYALRKKFELNAEVIYELNEARQKNNWYKLATVISSLYKSDVTGSSKSDQIHEAIVILRDFCENPADDIDDSLRPNRFSKATYSKLNNFESIKLREKIVLNSRKYLESQFKDFINELYSINKTQIINQDKFLIPNVDRVINFIELTLKTKQKQWKVPNMSFVNGLPLWAILFYLLRAGCYNEAIILVSKYEDSFSKLEKSFPFYLKSYCESNEKKLSEDLQGRLNNEFNQYFKNSTKDIDPFRYATYKLIGRCDLAKKSLPSITLSIEDWLWLNLSLINEEEANMNVDGIINETSSSSSFSDKYRLIDLQKNVLEFGSEAFNISSKNPMYLQTLLLVGLYEDAVKYLMFNNEIDAVHLAIILNYYGLIRISDEESNPLFMNSLLNIDSEGFKSINFARMIGNYVKKFKFSDPRVAAEYLFLICSNECGDKSFKERQIKICQASIRDLVLETREFVLLLGKITKNGTRIPGVIEERKSLIYLNDEKSFLYNISEKAAQKANEDGRLIDCILLYQLSEEYDIVLNIINKLLGDFLNSIDLINSKQSMNEILNNLDSNGETNIIKLANNLLKVYDASPKILSIISIKNRIDCKKLLEIFEIFKLFSLGNENDELNFKCIKIIELIKEINLIPILDSNDNMTEIRKFINEFNNYEECIMKNIPNLIMIEMICLQKLIFGNSNLNDEKMFELKQISKNLMIFAGLIKYKMPREIYSLLINLEINM